VPAGDYLVLEVEDRGQGMSPEVLSQAFDPFFTTKEVGQGTGLGLPVAFGIINGHLGFLTIASEAGKGTRIGIYLPRLTQPVADPTSANVKVLEPETLAQKNILVVDDEEAVQDVIRRFLQIAGHKVVCAASGKQALDCLKNDGIDLIVLDWMIPKEEGRTNFDRIRQVRPGLPVLLCTGLVEGAQATALLKEPAVTLLRKPFRMNELWYAVNKSLSSLH
jgi:CheY-like chemotaxis protein